MSRSLIKYYQFNQRTADVSRSLALQISRGDCFVDSTMELCFQFQGNRTYTDACTTWQSASRTMPTIQALSICKGSRPRLLILYCSSIDEGVSQNSQHLKKRTVHEGATMFGECAIAVPDKSQHQQLSPSSLRRIKVQIWRSTHPHTFLCRKRKSSLHPGLRKLRIGRFMVTEAVMMNKEPTRMIGATQLPWKVHSWRRLHQQATRAFACCRRSSVEVVRWPVAREA